jgi:hypothetical protein
MLRGMIGDVGDKNENAACFPDAQHALHSRVVQHVTVMDDETQAALRDSAFDIQFRAAISRYPWFP